MTKAEMISQLKNSVDGFTKAQAENALDAIIAIIKTRAARNGVNPRTGEKIKIAESKAVTFKAASALMDKVR